MDRERMALKGEVFGEGVLWVERERADLGGGKCGRLFEAGMKGIF